MRVGAQSHMKISMLTIKLVMQIIVLEHLAHFKHVIKIIMQELLQHINVTTKTITQ